MPTNTPVTELARKLCAATHKAEHIPGPTGGVPCSEHRRYGQLYYGLIDTRNKTMALALAKIIEEAQA